MANKLDITGSHYGNLVAVKQTDEKTANGVYKWECKCDCGGSVLVPVSELQRGKVKSCGCMYKKNKKRMGEKGNTDCVEDTKIRNLIAKTPKNNTSGHKGVYWMPKEKMWRARIYFQKKSYNLGVFSNYEQAVKAREKAEAEYFAPMLEKHGRKDNV